MSLNGGNKKYINDFVLAAISDATETIRFIDAKVGAILLLYGLIIASLIETRNSLYETIKIIYNCSLCLGNIFVILIVVAFIQIIISIIYSLLTIEPRIEPIKAFLHNISKDKQLWYMSSMSNDKKTLDITLDNYYNNLMKQDENSIIECEAFELLKLSFIRNKKLECFNNSFRYFMLSLLSITVIAAIVIVINIKQAV